MLFATLQGQLTPVSPSLELLRPTRWTIRTAAINSVLKYYVVLREALVEINTVTHDDYVRKDSAFMAQMEKVSTFWG